MKEKIIKISKWMLNLLKKIFKAIFIREKECCKVVLLFVAITACHDMFAQNIVRYDLYVKDTVVNYTGKSKHAIAINGSIPAPTLYFTEGDSAVIYVHNQLKKETTSLHWHGLILPNQYDGVPYLTTSPIKVGETHLYTFRIQQNGTYWYHSHSGLQEQSGMYGALIIHKKPNDVTFRDEDKIPEIPVVLSDWTNENPNEVHRSLHNANDWYAIKKGTTQDYLSSLKAHQFKTKIVNEWKRMLPMDVSDVYYNKFFINGQTDEKLTQFKAGDKVRLRISNAGSSSYFWLQYAGGKMIVVANDGIDVEPVEVDRMIIGVAETYDVIVTIPYSGSFEFRATAEDRTKYASLFLGDSIGFVAPKLPQLKYFDGMKMMNSMMKLSGKMEGMKGMQMSNQTMDMNNVMYPEISGYPITKKKKTETDSMKDMEMDMNDNADIVTLNYSMLKSPTKTTLNDAPTKILKFELTGNMNRYVWTMDNKTVSEADKIEILRGTNVRIILHNNSMMRHPMHLHGHFFRLLNGQGEYSPLKNTVDIMPMEIDTLEFAANETNDWFFHCHILYHMMSGMGRIFSYENSPPNPELPNPKYALKKLYKDDKKFHPMFRTGIESNGIDGEFMLANTRWKFQTEWRLGYHDMHGWEVESHFGRYVDKNQFIFPYVGFDFRYRKSEGFEKTLFQQTNTKNSRYVACVGLQYTLPLLIIADFRVDMYGKVRLQFSREDIALTKRLRFGFMVNSDKEYMVGLRYIVLKYLSISTHYDSDMGFGGGLIVNY